MSGVSVTPKWLRKSNVHSIRSTCADWMCVESLLTSPPICGISVSRRKQSLPIWAHRDVSCAKPWFLGKYSAFFLQLFGFAQLHLLVEDAELCFCQTPQAMDAEDPFGDGDVSQGTLIHLQKLAEDCKGTPGMVRAAFWAIGVQLCHERFRGEKCRLTIERRESDSCLPSNWICRQGPTNSRVFAGNCRRQVWRQDPFVARTLVSLGNAHGDLGDHSQLKVLLERAWAIQEQHYGKAHPEVAVTLTNLGNAHGDLRGYWRKKVLLEGALETQEQHYRKEHPAVAVTLTNLGNAHGKLGDYRLTDGRRSCLSVRGQSRSSTMGKHIPK